MLSNVRRFIFRLMKIATWNVNGIRASFDKGLEYFVKKHSPDILCLQETKAHPDQLDEKFRFSGYYSQSDWSSCGVKKGYSGTAIFSKKPANRIQKGIGIKKFDREGRILISEYDSFILLNIYFPNGAMTEERHLFKQEFLYRITLFVKFLEKTEKKGLVILGDYNTASLDIDVYDPVALATTSGFLPEEREWLKSFLSKGFIDVFRYFYSEEESAFTWWSYRENARKKNRGWRIDHICVNEVLKDKLKGIKIHQEQMGSDHCPVIMEMDS